MINTLQYAGYMAGPSTSPTTFVLKICKVKKARKTRPDNTNITVTIRDHKRLKSVNKEPMVMKEEALVKMLNEL